MVLVGKLLSCLLCCELVRSGTEVKEKLALQKHGNCINFVFLLLLILCLHILGLACLKVLTQVPQNYLPWLATQLSDNVLFLYCSSKLLLIIRNYLVQNHIDHKVLQNSYFVYL